MNSTPTKEKGNELKGEIEMIKDKGAMIISKLSTEKLDKLVPSLTTDNIFAPLQNDSIVGNIGVQIFPFEISVASFINSCIVNRNISEIVIYRHLTTIGSCSLPNMRVTYRRNNCIISLHNV